MEVAIALRSCFVGRPETMSFRDSSRRLLVPPVLSESNYEFRKGLAGDCMGECDLGGRGGKSSSTAAASTCPPFLLADTAVPPGGTRGGAILPRAAGEESWCYRRK